MKAFFILTRQRINDVMRSRSSASFMLLFPIVLLLVVGFVFEKGHPFELRHVGTVGEVSVETLAAYEEVRVQPMRDEREAMGKLKARMVSAVVTREGDALVLTVGPRDQLLARGMAEALGDQGRVEVRTIDVPSWGYVHYLFAGLLTFSVMVSGLFATGYTMSFYRQNRFLKKLATTPLPKATFVGAVVSARGVLILGQIALMLAVGAVAFDVTFDGVALGWTTVICVLGLLTFMGVGFALACVIRTEDLITDVISGVNMPLILLSEIFFPLTALPRPLAMIGEHLPSTEMVRLLRAVLLYGVRDAGPLLSGIGLLCVWVAATFAVSLAVFKWHE